MWKTATMIIVSVLMLVAIGIVMLASTSLIQAETKYGDALFFVKRQSIWLALGCLAAYVCARLPLTAWKTMALPLAAFTLLLLVLVLIPGIGLTIKGSSRWLRIGPVSLQPSEIAKLSAIVFLAWWMARNQRRAGEFFKGIVLPLGGLGMFLVLILAEPDFGTTMLIGVVGFALMFVGGTRVAYLLVTGVVGLSAFVFMIMQSPERMRRIIAFLNPDKYAKDEAFQLLNAIYAFVVGGPTGVGLGAGLQKQFYLPEAHTDFIFAIIGEELGLPFSLGIVVLFALLFIGGMMISRRSPDQFSRLLAFGVTVMISAQAALNIGVVTGCLPTKGLPLPFISFGGSSLVIMLSMVGILIQIALNPGEDAFEEE